MIGFPVPKEILEAKTQPRNYWGARACLTGGFTKTFRIIKEEYDPALARGDSFKGHSSYVVTVAFKPDGKRAISGGYDNTLCLWDATTIRQIRRFEGHTGYVEQVAVSPDGRLMVSGGHDKVLKLWSLPSTSPVAGKSP